MEFYIVKLFCDYLFILYNQQSRTCYFNDKFAYYKLNLRFQFSAILPTKQDISFL